MCRGGGRRGKSDLVCLEMEMGVEMEAEGLSEECLPKIGDAVVGGRWSALFTPWDEYATALLWNLK